MWPGFDPKILRDLQTVRQLFQLTQQTPTREWPLVFVEEHDSLFVVREWPDGTITAFMMPASAPARG